MLVQFCPPSKDAYVSSIISLGKNFQWYFKTTTNLLRGSMTQRTQENGDTISVLSDLFKAAAIDITDG